MGLQGRLSGFALPDPPPSLTGQFRDRIALRSKRADVEFPKALDLEANVLEALHGELHGVASALSGTHSPDHFRERLRGERAFLLGDLCRLATEPTREAKAGALAALGLIAQALGYAITPTGEEPGSLVDQVIAANQAALTAHALVTRAVSDGVVTPDEAASIRKSGAELRKVAGALAACEPRKR